MESLNDDFVEAVLEYFCFLSKCVNNSISHVKHDVKILLALVGSSF